MINSATISPELPGWHELYTAALFETDRDLLPERIAEAERAIVVRARELFTAAGDTIEEDSALDDALYALRALQNCLGLGQPRLPMFALVSEVQ